MDEISARKAWALIQGLPPEAATFRVDGQQWTLVEELLATLAELTDQWGLFHAYLHADKKGRRVLPDKPLEVPRPKGLVEQARKAEEDNEPVVTDVTVIQRFFSS